MYNIHKDIKTLDTFTSKYNYRLGVFLLYNYSMISLVKYIVKRRDVFRQYSNEKIILLCKKNNDTEIEIMKFSNLISEFL